MNRRLNTQQTGFTLLEVLVAIVIISIGLLGLISLQTASLQKTEVSAATSQATIAASSMVSRMRANMAGVKNGDYGKNYSNNTLSTNSITPISCNSISTTGNKSNVAIYDLKQWYCSLKTALPNPTGTIEQKSSNPYRFKITIAWHPHHHTKGYQTPHRITQRVIL